MQTPDLNRRRQLAAFAGVAAGMLVAVTGCGGAGSHQSAGRSALGQRHASVTDARQPRAPESQSPPTAGYNGPHFATKAAAMRFVALAWNRRDTRALSEVTSPQAFTQLMDMHSQAADLRFTSCSHDDCHFTHGFPASMHATGHGSATVLIQPGRGPGWIVASLVDCGGP